MRISLTFMVLLVALTACNANVAPTPILTEVTATTLPPTTTIPSTAPEESAPISTIEPTAIAEANTSLTGNGGSYHPMMSGDGRFIVFASDATDLIEIPAQPPCTRNEGEAVGERCTNIYRFDRQMEELVLVSVGRDGNGAEGASILPSISDDGRYIVFVSSAPNLDPEADAYCEQLQRGPCGNIFLYDHTTGTLKWISRPADGENPDNYSLFPHISGDGQAVVYMSVASNLVANDTNGVPDIFLYDIASGATQRISVSSDGEEGNDTSYFPSISQEGRFITFSSAAGNLIPDDTNNTADVFVYDMELSQTTRVSVASDGTEGDNFSERSTISNNGRYVAFESVATTIDPIDGNFSCDLDGDDNPSENCRDIYLHDRETGNTTLISLSSNGGQSFQLSLSGHISGDGMNIAFANTGTGLVPRDRNEAFDLFVHELSTANTTRVSVATDGTEGNHNSGFTSNPFELRGTFDISDDGRYVIFSSSATNFVENDFNDGEHCDPILIQGGYALQCSDIFLHDRDTGETLLISRVR